MFGCTSQPLAMLCATWSLESDVLCIAPFVKARRQHSLIALKGFREARRGPLQPIGRRLFRSAVANDRQSRFSRIEPVIEVAAELG
jgi:hypothetical protein